ncbi:thermonuclease family protein [Salimicrobium flavidum]|uniref:Micrococcal nuclease n=1 Tax=Salimicrobium flavidum TaxID=570947 RepID=A0A1N7KCX5_9BACI|nr:thermonuclease family protein [Salimicrobium flavidum]SIS59457.1 micrococcal nuclease [Salimicrobium flavidum]
MDGDTIKLVNGDSVRFLSIDSPESTGEYENDPMPYGEEASAFVKEHVPGGSLITIVFDGDKRDKYDRLLGYIELPDGRDLNKMLLEKGDAEIAYVYDDYERLGAYREAEEQAKQQNKGIWKLNG